MVLMVGWSINAISSAIGAAILAQFAAIGFSVMAQAEAMGPSDLMVVLETHSTSSTQIPFAALLFCIPIPLTPRKGSSIIDVHLQTSTSLTDKVTSLPTEVNSSLTHAPNRVANSAKTAAKSVNKTVIAMTLFSLSRMSKVMTPVPKFPLKYP